MTRTEGVIYCDGFGVDITWNPNIFSDEGNDTIYGGDLYDILMGGPGVDILWDRNFSG